MKYPCKCCGKEVPQSERFLSGGGGRQKVWCSESCRQKWRYHNDDTYRSRDTYTPQKSRGYRAKYTAIQLKGGKCMECGETSLSTLCFHHRDPAQKSFGLDNRCFASKKWDTLVKEIDKCDLLCHNCHSKHHYSESWEDMLSQMQLETCIQLSLDI